MKKNIVKNILSDETTASKLAELWTRHENSVIEYPLAGMGSRASFLLNIKQRAGYSEMIDIDPIQVQELKDQGIFNEYIANKRLERVKEYVSKLPDEAKDRLTRETESAYTLYEYKRDQMNELAKAGF